MRSPTGIAADRCTLAFSDDFKCDGTLANQREGSEAFSSVKYVVRL